MIEYYERNYIGCEIGRGNRRRRVEPRYQIEKWNVQERILKDLFRTNNQSEGNNNAALRSNMTRTHPDLWSFIEALKKEEYSSVMKMFSRGANPKKKQNICSK